MLVSPSYLSTSSVKYFIGKILRVEIVVLTAAGNWVSINVSIDTKILTYETTQFSHTANLRSIGKKYFNALQISQINDKNEK